MSKAKKRLSIQALNDLLNYLHTNYNINFGGCCLVSYYIATHLYNLKIKYKLVIYNKYIDYSSKDARYNIKNNIKNKFPAGSENCSHYALQVKKSIINPYVHSGSYESLKISNISPLDIYNIYNQGYWSNFYDRDNNEEVRILINNFFKSYY